MSPAAQETQLNEPVTLSAMPGDPSRVPEPQRSAHRLRSLIQWVHGWALFAQAPAVICYVLVVDAIAITVTVGASFLRPVTGTELVRFGVLTACAIVHVEASRTVERRREAD